MKTSTVGELLPGTYFRPLNCVSPFYVDDELRFTRMWDGAYADEFFKNKNDPVEILTRNEAVELALAYRRNS